MLCFIGCECGEAYQRILFIGQYEQGRDGVSIGTAYGQRPFVGVENFWMLHLPDQCIPLACQQVVIRDFSVHN